MPLTVWLFALLSCAGSNASAGAEPTVQASSQESNVSDPISLYRAWVAARGGDINGALPCPEHDAGSFLCFRGGTADFAWVSPAGVVDLSGGGDWAGFLQQGDAAAVHTRLSMMDAGRMAQPLTPQQPRPSQVSEAEWAAVTAPVVEPLGPGGWRFNGWFGYPPSFVPAGVEIQVLPGQPLKVTSRPAVPATASSVADALLAALSGTDRMGQKQAADKLGELRDPRAVPGLIALLASPWGHARQSAASALGKIGDPSAVPAIEAALKAETDAWTAGMMLAGLGAIPGAEATAALQRLAADSLSGDLKLQAQGLLMVRP